MAIIREDESGVYAKVDGHIVRPEVSYEVQLINGEGKTVPKYHSSFKKGEKVVGFHFRGSTLVGMGKLEKKGEYQEYWRTSQ